MRDKDVIQHIQDLCKERSWTYYRLAKEADIPYSTLNNMVNRTNIPTIPTLQKLCDAFGITLADFFLDEPDALQLTEGQQEIITLYNNLSLEKKKILKAINEQISNFAQTYPTNLKASSNEALLFMRRYRFANCSCFSCCFKDAYPSSNVQ